MADQSANNIQHAQRREEGQVIVLFALFAVVLVGFLALAVDAGFLLSQRREAQAAADAAAMAGGAAMLAGETDGVIRDTSEAYLAVNGIDMTAVGVASTISPAGDQHDGSVTVDVTVPVERFFLGAIYTGDWEVGAHAVAEIGDDRDGQYALLALDPAGMYVNGEMRVTVINGSAMSNGNVENSGGSSFFITDGTIDAVGDIQSNSNWSAPDGMYENRGTMPDPLNGAVPPDPSELLLIEEDMLPSDCDMTCTLQPGYYRNLTLPIIKGEAELLPGIYYFENTAVRLLNDTSRITGDGVMLYFTGPTGLELFKPKNGAVHLTRITDGPIYDGGPNGMVVWIANCGTFNSYGDEEFYIHGLFYAPCSQVWLHGNPYGETIEGQVIVGVLDVRGDSEMIVRYHNYVATPRFELWLVE